LKRALIISAILLVASAAGARAEMVNGYRDLIRPHGQPRSEAIYQASVNFCYGQTGANRDLRDTREFKQCMLTRGYYWEFSRPARDAPAAVPKKGAFGGTRTHR
jgi:hypothetical protein